MMPAAPRLKMLGVSKRFGATRALKNVDLEVAPGEILALVGENGAGKSTLMKVLSGAHQPDDGQMWLDGEPYRPRNPLDARERGIAMVYQELSLAPHLSVMENILLGIEPTTGPDRTLAGNEVASRGGAGRDWHRRHSARNRSSPTLLGPAADGRDRPGGRARKPRAGARRTDEQPRPPRHRAAVRLDSPAPRPWHRGDLHFALSGRSLRNQRSLRRASRRRIGRRRSNAWHIDRSDCRADGRPRRGRSLSSFASTRTTAR